jgi:hypothetical protein
MARGHPVADQREQVVRPLAEDGAEAIGSMGDDTPMWVLSRRVRPLYDAFRQQFAQVTNPPIDPIREQVMMSLESCLGPEANPFDVGPDDAHRLVLDSPVLSTRKFNELRSLDRDGWTQREIALERAADEDLSDALDRLCAECDRAVRDGALILVLSDRDATAERMPVHALLAVGAIHHHLAESGLRCRTNLVVDTGTALDPHHVACLIGFGATTVHAWLAYEIVLDPAGGRQAGKKAGLKLYGKSRPMGAPVLDAWPEDGLPPGAIYLSCGDSTATDLPDRCVDAVITDPPFYDNVHYSELADFFHVWQSLWLTPENNEPAATTRNAREVQDTDSGRFSDKLTGVFAECHRVLKDDGLLVFSYHHSREDGWISVAAAVLSACFKLVQAQPVKAEMSVATPKLAAKSPIDLDVLMVCRKAADDRRRLHSPADALETAESAASDKVARFNRTGRRLSLNDVRIVVFSQALVELCAGRKTDDVLPAFELALTDCAAISQRLFAAQDERQAADPATQLYRVVQPSLF